MVCYLQRTKTTNRLALRTCSHAISMHSFCTSDRWMGESTGYVAKNVGPLQLLDCSYVFIPIHVHVKAIYNDPSSLFDFFLTTPPSMRFLVKGCLIMYVLDHECPWEVGNWFWKQHVANFFAVYKAISINHSIIPYLLDGGNYSMRLMGRFVLVYGRMWNLGRYVFNA